MQEFVEDKDVQLKFKDVCLSRSIISLPGASSGDIIILISLCTLLYYSQYPGIVSIASIVVVIIVHWQA